MNQPSSMDKFRATLYEILLNPPEKGSVVQGRLTEEQTALQDAILRAVDQLFDDASFEIAMASADAIGLTLLGIYNEGRIPGELQSEVLQKVAAILVGKASENGREVNAE